MFALVMLNNSNRILFADEAQNAGIAVVTVRLCNEVCGQSQREAFGQDIRINNKN